MESGIHGFGIRNPRLCNAESTALESGIPLKTAIRNPSSTDKKSGIQHLESGIHGVESRIIRDIMKLRRQREHNKKQNNNFASASHIFFCQFLCRRCTTKATCKRTQQLPTMLGVVSQQCCVRLLGAKSTTGFKLCATTRNNIQQHATGCANRRNM